MMPNNGNERSQLHDSVKIALKNCIEINNPSWTKDTIKSLLVAESPQGVLELICVLLEELSVYILNSNRTKKIIKQRGKTSGIENTSGKPKSSKALVTDKQRLELSNSRLSQHIPMETNGALAKSTRLGTVALPKVLDDFKISARKNNKSNVQKDDASDISASDIPSQSSESSNDAQSGNDSAVEAEWGLHISTGALQPPSVMLSESQRSTANIDVASSSTVPTHGDFFNSLVNDIGQLESFQPQPAAALDDERIYIAIWTALTADDDSSNNVCTAETLNQLARSLVHRLGLEEAFGERMEDMLAVRFAAFSGCPINTESCSLIAQVVKITVQQMHRDGSSAKITDFNDEGVGFLADEEPTQLELGSPPAAKIADEDDEFDISPYNRGKNTSGAKENSVLRTPQVRMSGSKKDRVESTPAGDGPYLPETPPAWLIPKSPLDSVFRKRYGGLGDPELTQVITIIDSQRKGPKEKVYQSKEVEFDDEDSLYSPSLSTESEDIGVEDLPRNFGWNETDSPHQKSGSATKNMNYDKRVSLSPSQKGGVGEDGDADGDFLESEDIHPSNHPSVAVPRNADGSPLLTSNDNLNRMLAASFQGFVKQYADQGEKLFSLQQGATKVRPGHKSNNTAQVAKKSTGSPSPKVSLSGNEFLKSASPKERRSFEVASDSIDYESYERLMDRTIRKTNQLIQSNSKSLRSLALAIEEEERQRELHYPKATTIATKSRSDSYLHVSSPTSALRSSGSGSLGGNLPIRRRSSSNGKSKRKSAIAETFSDDVIQTNKKVSAKAKQLASRYQVPSGSMDSDEEGADNEVVGNKTKKKSKKTAKKKATSSSSPPKSFQKPTFSTSQRVLDLEQADVPYPYSYPTPMPPGIAPPLGLWSSGLSRQNKQEYEKMVKKMVIAGQLQSRHSTASTISTFSNGKKK